MCRYSKQTIFAFIDSQNLNLGVAKYVYDNKGQELYSGWKLDFRKFFIYLQDKHRVTCAFLFIGYIKENQALYKKLESFGYKLIFKPVQRVKDSDGMLVKGNVDAELVLHAMINYTEYDKAVIVTGDSDFYCLIEYLIKQGKFAKLLIPNKFSYASLFRKFGSYLDFVSDSRDKLELKDGHNLLRRT